MDYFNDNAAFTYFELIQTSYDLELFDKTIYLERLYDLQNYCNGENHKAFMDYINMTVLDLEGNQARFKAYEEEISKDDENLFESPFANIKMDERLPPSNFKSTTPGKICNWHFHKKDLNSFPSVPHAFGADNFSLKLNPFSGFIFNGRSKFDREDKQYIINLWNDPVFRSYAKNAMDNYMKYCCTAPWEEERFVTWALVWKRLKALIKKKLKFGL